MAPADRTAGARALTTLAAVTAAVVTLTALGPVLHHTFGGLAHWAVVGTTAAAAAWAATSDHGSDRRSVLVIIAAGAIAMRLAMLLFEPYLSDDIYRYVWDGRVQAAGINPYRHIPASPELQHLRDAAIYPLINRADYAPTIYPPVAQMFFFVITRLGENVLTMRLGLLLCEAVAILATLKLLVRLDLPTQRIAAFAWHPLAVWEVAGSGHVDALMLALLVPAVLAFLNGRTLLAVALATAGALAKPVALLALPVFWRPWDWKAPAVALATVCILYAPYLSVGAGVLGFLPQYVHEEELSHGSGFRYVLAAERLFGPLPGAALAYAVAAAFIMIGAALAVGFRSDRSNAGSVTALTMLLAAFLVLLTPHYPWYYLALVPLVAVYPASWTLWLLTVGGMQTYQAVPGEVLPDYVDRQVVFHGLVLVAIARDLVVARGHGRTPINDALKQT